MDLQITFPEHASFMDEDALPPGWATRAIPRIGMHQETPPEFRGDLASRLNWQEMRSGHAVGTVTVASPEAAAFRARLELGAVLPSGAAIRYFELSKDGGDTLVHEQSIDPSRNALPRTVSIWSPTIHASRLGIEIVLPDPGSASDLSLKLLEISVQSQLGVADAMLPSSPFSTECDTHVDVQCSSDSSLRGKVAAVGRVLVEKSGAPAFCTGTLLNSRDPVVDAFSLGDNGPAPYLLTSHNCVATQYEADSMEVTWFYENGTCGSEGIDHRAATTFGGAELLATSVESDSSLLRLRQDVPGGLVYSGWRASSLAAPSGVATIHHPRGAVKKVSSGEASRHVNRDDLPDDAIEVRWSEGATERGSEGAGLFAGGYLVGVLSQTASSCIDGVSYFAPFEKFYPRIQGYLLGDHADTPDAATIISVPASIRAGLFAGDSDHFQVDIASANRLIVYSTGDTDTKAVLTRDDGTEIAQADGGALGQNFMIEADVDPGRYLIEVSGGTESASGDYTLEASLDRAGPPTAAPTNVRVERGALQFRVKWDSAASTDSSGGPISGYSAVASDSQGRTRSCRVPAHVRTCLITGLQPEVEYSVYVRGTNPFGVGPDSASVASRPLVPDERSPGFPPLLEGVRVSLERSSEESSGKLTLTVHWSRVPVNSGGEHITGYFAEAAAGEMRLHCEAETDKNSCSMSFAEETAYSVTAWAENAVGTGPRSPPIMVTPVNSSDHGDTRFEATEVGANSVTLGHLAASDTDWFKFEVVKAGTLYAWTSGRVVDTRGFLRSDTADELCSWNNDQGVDSNFSGSCLVSPGTHYVRVTHWYEYPGDYTLHLDLVEDDHGDTRFEATEVGANSVTLGHLAASDTDWFKFEVVKAGTLYAWTSGRVVDTRGFLRSDTADELCSWNNDQGVDSNFSGSCLVSPGTHYVRVTHWYEYPGDYTLHLDFRLPTTESSIPERSSRSKDLDEQVLAAPRTRSHDRNAD